MTPYRGTTRAEMERVGKALPKKEGDYRCVYGCGLRSTHDRMHHHQLDECPYRPGSTVNLTAKRP